MLGDEPACAMMLGQLRQRGLSPSVRRPIMPAMAPIFRTAGHGPAPLSSTGS